MTSIFMGQPRPARGLRRLEESLPGRLARRPPGVDVRIMADARVGSPADSESSNLMGQRLEDP